jgi:hypothetical protein
MTFAIWDVGAAEAPRTTVLKRASFEKTAMIDNDRMYFYFKRMEKRIKVL